MKNDETKYPRGWSEDRALDMLEFYEAQSDEEAAAEHEAGLRYITNENGEKQAVVLPIREYEALLEDLRDLATLAERRDEPSISHQDALGELD